jgi:hypothetical protein
MRELTSKQKKLLRKSLSEYCNTYHTFPSEAGVLDNYDEIEAVNPTEVFWQNANRYVEDLIFSGEFDRRM